MSSDDDCCPELVSATGPLMPDENISNQLALRTKEFEEKSKQQLNNEDDAAAIAKAIVNEEQNRKQALNDHPPVPLVILSGFLGSGKTSLIQYILAVNHGLKIAVIVNEFEFGRSIEKGLTVKSAEASEDEWMELKNGCMCCSAKSQSVQALEQLVTKRGGELDAILIETAGLADPVPIARSFWLDEALQAKVQLAGIVVVVDSVNIEGYIKSEKNKFIEAARQLLSADRIVMNKIDACGFDAAQNFSFLDEQNKVNDFLFSSSSSSCPEKLRNAALTVKEVNPVAPITLTCLQSLLKVEDESAKVPADTLKKLLLLSAATASGMGDGHQAASASNNNNNINNNMRWKDQTSSHQHTSEMTSKQIELTGRAFKSVRDVDFFYATVLDNSVDGQDENDEELPAQLRAKDRGSVVVRSKSAVWVKNPEFDSNNNNNSTTTMEYLAYQIQSIGSTFEVVPMAGLNKKYQDRRASGSTKKNDVEESREDSAEPSPSQQEQEDDDILKFGMSRMLFLGFGLREEEIVSAFNAKTVEM